MDKTFLIVEIPGDYCPEEGDAMDSVTAALSHFFIPAYIYESKRDPDEMIVAARAALELLENPDAEPEMADAVMAELRCALAPFDSL